MEGDFRSSVRPLPPPAPVYQPATKQSPGPGLCWATVRGPPPVRSCVQRMYRHQNPFEGVVSPGPPPCRTRGVHTGQRAPRWWICILLAPFGPSGLGTHQNGSGDKRVLGRAELERGVGGGGGFGLGGGGGQGGPGWGGGYTIDIATTNT